MHCKLAAYCSFSRPMHSAANAHSKHHAMTSQTSQYYSYLYCDEMQAQLEDGGCEWAGLTHLQASHTFLLLQEPQLAYWLVIYTVTSVQ